jgi:hypothetical protein
MLMVISVIAGLIGGILAVVGLGTIGWRILQDVFTPTPRSGAS